MLVISGLSQFNQLKINIRKNFVFKTIAEFCQRIQRTIVSIGFMDKHIATTNLRVTKTLFGFRKG